MTTKFKGIKVTIGEMVDLVVPPLNFDSLEELQDDMASFSGGVDKQSRATVLKVAHHALRRNYPDMKIEDLRANLDVGNMQDVMEAAMDVSGLKRKGLEAAELEAGGDPSTGPNSTHT